ncbi:MAG: histidinol phosphate phosphatase, partial [Lachnospira sp.]|nr:histidinol phosphate phosphatase [Lachnospira sp.]
WEDYKELIDNILTSLITQGKGIEINTSSLTKGLHSTNPCSGIIRRYKELGGEIITIGSDAHCPANIASEFDKAKDILTDAGFKYYTHFIERTPHFIKL